VRDLADISEQEQRLLYALALMCSQYMGEEHDGREVLDHMCMGAGEQAYEVLLAYGLIEIEGRSAIWTKAGLKLFDLPMKQRDFPQ
jgi:hypothetical protein